MNGWRWEKRGAKDVLLAPDGLRAATVEPQVGVPYAGAPRETWTADGDLYGYVWSTWDPDGVGGENSSEQQLQAAKWCADRAARVWWYENGWATPPGSRLTVVILDPEKFPVPFPDARDLLERAARNFGQIVSFKYSGPAWHVACRLFGLGSTYSAKLLEACGVDPQKRVGPTEWEALEAIVGPHPGDLTEERWTEITDCEPPPESERYR